MQATAPTLPAPARPGAEPPSSMIYRRTVQRAPRARASTGYRARPARRAALWLLALAPAAAAQPLDPYGYMLIEPPRGSFFGESVAMPGDLDRDGHADFVVGNRVEAVVFSGRTGKEIATLPIVAGNALERLMAAAGDVDGDGVGDVIASWPGWNGDIGVVQVFSGRTFAELHRFTHAPAIDNYGSDIASAGDVDNDGCDDVIIGAHTGNQQWSPGYAEVRSGRTGAVLHRWDGPPNTNTVIGHSVAGVGDVDLDGHDDVVVGRFGGAELYSGQSGAMLQTWTGSNRSFGRGSSGVGDIDGDAVPDVAIRDSAVSPGYRIWIFSGATGSTITFIDGREPGARLGSIAVLGDINGDGRAEHVIGAAGGPSVRGYVQVISIGTTGTVRVRFTVQGAVGEHLGWAMDAGCDVNGDGVPDAVVGAPQQPVPGSGYARVVSGKRLHLVSDSNCISLASGGSQSLTLWARAGNAGRPYWVLGSTSGHSPAIPLGACNVPLVPDWYTVYTVQSPNSAPLSSSVGTLDGSGFATATFTLPPGLPPVLAGMTIWHAYVAFDQGSGACVRDSNAIPVTLVQ